MILPNKFVQELRNKFADLPKSLADIESEIMNFNAQLSCQGTVKDDVSTKVSLLFDVLCDLFIEFFFLFKGYAFISKRKNKFSSI